MAEQRFADIQGLANAVLFDLHDAIEPLPGSTRARELLVNKAQQYLDKLGADSAGDRSLEHERALSYERIGDVLGLSTQPNLGKTGDAVKAYDRALRLRPSFTRVYKSKAQALEKLGRYEQALAAYNKALELEPKLFSLLVSKSALD